MIDGHVLLFNGVMLYRGEALENKIHAHYPASLYLGKNIKVTLGNGQQLNGDAILVGPNQKQAANIASPFIDLLIDAESTLFERLSPLLGRRKAICLEADNLDASIKKLDTAVTHSADCSTVRQAIDAVLGVFAEDVKPIAMDARIREIGEELSRELPTELEPAALASRCGLSESRFLHLFKAEFGLPMRQYILWQRLLRCIQIYQQKQASGEDINFTDLAMESGFYDHAHLTKTVRRMLDTTPSMLNSAKGLQLRFCFECG